MFSQSPKKKKDTNFHNIGMTSYNNNMQKLYDLLKENYEYDRQVNKTFDSSMNMTKTKTKRGGSNSLTRKNKKNLLMEWDANSTATTKDRLKLNCYKNEEGFFNCRTEESRERRSNKNNRGKSTLLDLITKDHSLTLDYPKQVYYVEDSENSKDSRNTTNSCIKLLDKNHLLGYQTMDNTAQYGKEKTQLLRKRKCIKKPKMPKNTDTLRKSHSKSNEKNTSNTPGRDKNPKKSRDASSNSLKQKVKKTDSSIINRSRLAKLDFSHDQNLQNNNSSSADKKKSKKNHIEPKTTLTSPKISNILKTPQNGIDIKRNIERDSANRTSSKSKDAKSKRFSEKDVLEMNSKLLGFYDNLIERDHSSSKLLQTLKENFIALLKEYENNSKIHEKQIKENQRLKQELNKLTIEKQKLENQLGLYLKDNRKLTKFTSPKGSTENKISGNYSSSKKMQKSYENINTKGGNNNNNNNTINRQIHENLKQDHEKLLYLLQKQQNIINILRQKETKYIKLLLAIKNNGLDIKKIYNEQVKASLNNSNINENTMNNNQELKGFNLIKNSLPITDNNNTNTKKQISPNGSFEYENPETSSSRIMLEQDYKYSSGNKYMIESETQAFIKSLNDKYQNNDGSELPTPMNTTKSIHNDIGNQVLNEKLRLNLSILNETNQNDSNDASIKQPLGFHEEFMSKLKDFSLSWRQAAMKEKKF